MNILRVRDVAKKLSVSQPTVWRWAKEGLLPKPFSIAGGTTVWDEADIDKWLTEQKEMQHESD